MVREQRSGAMGAELAWQEALHLEASQQARWHPRAHRQTRSLRSPAQEAGAEAVLHVVSTAQSRVGQGGTYIQLGQGEGQVFRRGPEEQQSQHQKLGACQRQDRV